MLFDRRAVCLCCGESAVQQSRIDIYRKKNGHGYNDGETEGGFVICDNKACGRWQSLTCAMNMCSRVLTHVPPAAYLKNTWVQAMMPYFHRTTPIPSSKQIHVSNCISCCLSCTIPDSIKPSLKKVPIPDPISTSEGTYISVAKGILSDNLTKYPSQKLCTPSNKLLTSPPSNNDDYDSDSDCSEMGVLVPNDDLSCSSSESDWEIEDEEDILINATIPMPPSLATAPIINSKRKRGIKESVHRLRTLPTSKPDVMDFLSQYQTADLKPPNYSKLTRKLGRKKRAAVEVDEDLVLGGEFVGALYIPSHKLIICSYSCNDHLYVDVHGMAKSASDLTPHIPHMVLSEADAISLSKHYDQNEVKPPYLPNEAFTSILVDGVEMPEDEQKSRDWVIDYAELKQKVKIKDATKENGRTAVPLEELLQCQIFSYKRLRKKADHVILCGDFSMEDNVNLRTNGSKLLTMRMQKLVTLAIPDKKVETLLSNLLPVAGNKGNEVTRNCGTNGFTSAQTHKDLLFVLRENDTLLPNKAGACLIIPHDKQYYLLYSKHKPDKEDHPIGITTYGPPKPGGSLMINGNAIDEWPIIGEFAYVKMIATLILNRLNVILQIGRAHV